MHVMHAGAPCLPVSPHLAAILIATGRNALPVIFSGD
jgi:hypothetical protein